MIDLTISTVKNLERAVQQERNILIPTFRQQRDPGHIPLGIVRKLSKALPLDVDPINLFRINWQ